MNKQIFQRDFYELFRSNIVGLTDDLLRNRGAFTNLTQCEKDLFEVAKRFVLRPDIFSNLVFLTRFCLTMFLRHDLTRQLIDFNPKLSSSCVSMLFTFYDLDKKYNYECKENN